LVDVFFVSVSLKGGGVDREIALFQLNILEERKDEKCTNTRELDRRNKLS